MRKVCFMATTETEMESLKDFFPPAQSPAPAVRTRPSASVAVATSPRPYWKKKRPVNVQVDATIVPEPVVTVDLPATSSHPGMPIGVYKSRVES